MARGTQRHGVPDVTPQNIAETTPQPFVSPDHSFTLQAVMEVQKTIGRLEHAVETLTEESKKNRGILEDINKKIYAAKVLISVLFGSGILMFIINKFWDKISIITK